MIALNDKYSAQDVLEQYHEVFVPAEVIFFNSGKLAELKFIMNSVMTFRENDALLLNFIVAEIQRNICTFVTGGSGTEEGEKQLVK